MEEKIIHIINGGDGTFLHHVHKLVENDSFDDILFGVNRGHVGFLCNETDELQDQISQYIENRWMIQIEGHKCLNEIVFSSKNKGKLFEIEIIISNESLIFQGDGLIISTATGSTAYNLSAGGPIIEPTLKCIILTPICPFTLSARPIVVSQNIIVKPLMDYMIHIDGFETDLKKSKFEINLVEKPLKIIKFNNFIKAIQKKLNWNQKIK